MQLVQHSFYLLQQRANGIFVSLIELIPNILFALLFFFLGYSISNRIRAYLSDNLPTQGHNQLAKRIITDVIYAIILIVICCTTLSILNLDKAVYSLLTGAGVFGIVIGFAFQDLSANLIGGLMIAFQSPFELGHSIKIGAVDGTVTRIGLRVTQITLPTKEEVYIPNKTFLSENLINYSIAGERKIVLKIHVPCDFDFEKFSSAVKAKLKDLYGRKEMTDIEVYSFDFVNTLNLGDSGPISIDNRVEILISYTIVFPGQNNYMVSRAQAIERIAKILNT